MESTIFSGQQAPSAAYDYRVYDQVWQRVIPGVDPYSEDAAVPAQEAARVPLTPPVPASPAQAAPQPRQESGGKSNLPGAAPNPCCMGTNAQESVEVLEGSSRRSWQAAGAATPCYAAFETRLRSSSCAALPARSRRPPVRCAERTT